MQFPPTVWGPFFWHTIHIIALGYPINPTYTDKKCAKEFFESLAYLLPCGVCREHYAKHLEANPISTFVDTKKDLLKWTILIHNEVNKSLNKPIWTEYEVLKYYERIGKRNRSPVWTKEDMKEIDYQSFIRGFLVGSAVLGGALGAAYFVNKWS
jgi:hypothetical protein